MYVLLYKTTPLFSVSCVCIRAGGRLLPNKSIKNKAFNIV